jgi:putative ABC transport system permease protein
MMILENTRIALLSISRAKTRSLLTLLGIIIGVFSVVTIVAFGEGVKRSVSGSVDDLGSRLVNISPGETVKKDKSGNIAGYNLLASYGASTLSEKDIDGIKKIPEVAGAAPIMIVTGNAEIKGQKVDNSFIIATTEDYQKALQHKVKSGSFFSDDDKNAKIATIGQSVNQKYFRGENPIGRPITIKGEKFVVTGVMNDKQLGSGGVDLGAAVNNAIFISLPQAKKLNNDNVQIAEIDVIIKEGVDVAMISDKINATIKNNHKGQQDFTVIKQDEILDVTNSVFNYLTGFVALVAMISVVVGSIGIMNVMLLSVTERTQEIGLRKAIGATEFHILTQFLIEAVVLSLVGGGIGLGLAWLVSFVGGYYFDIEPKITIVVAVTAMVGSGLIGVVSGLWPALKASRKHPIDALRFEGK